ncbi:TPA: hypothetical protein HA251_03870 [Candidatus Woesearchaeota archaeon]|nr:hypothetical protein [Candidatus Woesearchaeota archaeon]
MVTLPGYHCIMDAQVYARDHDGKEHDILLFGRWREPTVQEVVHELHTQVKRIEQEHGLDEKNAVLYAHEGNRLAAELLTLSPLLLHDLRDLHPRGILFVSDIISSLPDAKDTAPMHLDCCNGRLPAGSLRDADAYSYLRMLRTNDAVRYTVSLHLEDWVLRPKDAVLKEFLTQHTAMRPRHVSELEVTTMLDAIYAGFSTRDDVLCIPDRTSDALENGAYLAVKGMQESIRTTAIFMEGMRAGLQRKQDDDSEGDAVTQPDDIVN